MCSCCGEPWSKHASNHQPGCKDGAPLFVPDEIHRERKRGAAVAPSARPRASQDAAHGAAPSHDERWSPSPGERARLLAGAPANTSAVPLLSKRFAIGGRR